jgi:hypothetical protein
MSTTGIDESEGQCPLILNLYLGQLFYLACSSSHLYGSGLSFKLFSLHSKLFKNCALWPKASLKRWLGPQVDWFVPQVIQRRYLVPQGIATALLQLLRSFMDLSLYTNLQSRSKRKA